MLKTVKVVGLNSDATAAQVLLVDSNPRLYAIVTAACDDAFGRCRQALLEAEDLFYSLSDPIAHRISQTLGSIKDSLAGAEGLQVLVAVVQENDAQGMVLYLAGQGSSLKSFLVRDGGRADLLTEPEGGLVSGFLQEGDRVVLTTSSLVELLGSEASGLSDWSIDSLEDEVLSRLPQALVDPVAAVVLERELEVAEDIPAVAAPQSDKMFARQLKQLSYLTSIVPRGPKVGALLGVALLGVVLIGVVISFTRKKAPPPAGSQQAVVATQPEQPLAEVAVWLDLELVKKGFAADSLSLSIGKILVLDSSQKTLAQIDAGKKSSQLLAGEDKLGAARLASLNGESAFVFSFDKGVVRVDTASKSASVAVKKAEGWEGIAHLYGFAGNIYLLDTAKNQILKHVPIAAGYADARPYFKEETKADLQDVVRMQIDGSVWLLKKSGEILKYTQGLPDHFSLGGLDKGIRDPKSFFVSSDTENLYILDSGNNRVVVVDKKGGYLAQYLAHDLSGFSDLVVDEQGKKVYLLSGSKIYTMDLK